MLKWAHNWKSVSLFLSLPPSLIHIFMVLHEAEVAMLAYILWTSICFFLNELSPSQLPDPESQYSMLPNLIVAQPFLRKIA